ncbi:hypothetical protein [Leptospira biflexa]|uniref:hypothetical protein n=1 Tax=Leptospira biflexa TaxID=172 RepID=UPI0010844026|nr:hypothetical protein [Leptospira biflexa]TGM32199.1 hypothetical protein EHQ80_18060 [Leptospira biflexa]TGM42176.1 hypothetical protein EHQ89_01290 [Leptospira biflexa]
MKKTKSNSEKVLSKHAGSPKLIKTSKPKFRSDGSLTSLNEFITESRHPVFTVSHRNKKTGKKTGKALSFKETVEAWEEGILNDCKGENQESCFTEQENDLPEYCLMGNPRTCIKKRTFKLLREKLKLSVDDPERIHEEIHKDYDWIDGLSKQELEIVMEEQFSHDLEEIPF